MGWTYICRHEKIVDVRQMVNEILVYLLLEVHNEGKMSQGLRSAFDFWFKHVLLGIPGVAEINLSSFDDEQLSELKRILNTLYSEIHATGRVLRKDDVNKVVSDPYSRDFETDQILSFIDKMREVLT